MLRTVTVVITGAAVALATIGAQSPAQARPRPTSAMSVWLASTAVDGGFSQLDWRDDSLHVVQSTWDGPRIVSTPDGVSVTTRTVAVPDDVVDLSVHGFAVGPDGSYYLADAFHPRNEDTFYTGVTEVSADGTGFRPATPGRTPYSDLGGLVMAPSDDGLWFGGGRPGTTYDHAGQIAALPLPLPADQSAPAVLAGGAEGCNTAEAHHCMAVPRDLYWAATVYSGASGYVYETDVLSATILLVDPTTGDTVVSLGGTYYLPQWESPDQFDGSWVGGAALDPGAIAVDRAGNIFVAVDGGRQLYEITAADSTLHWIAGGGDQIAAPGVAPKDAVLNITDLAIDDDGNVYASSDVFSGSGRHSEVLQFPGLADVGAPSLPRDVDAQVSDASARITFDPPSDPGASAVTGYVVRAHPHGGAGDTDDVVVHGDDAPIRLTGLTNGTTYDVVVAAVNEQGEGLDSDAVQVTPRPVSAKLTVSATAGTAPFDVDLDAGGSDAPAGASFQFYCGDSYDATGAPSSTDVASCHYDRGSPAEGWNAYVVMHDPISGRDYQDTVQITVDPEAGTIENSHAFDTGAPAAATAGADGGLDAAGCGSATDWVCDVVVDGVQLRLAAGPGTFQPGTQVFVAAGDTAALQDELGTDQVQVQGGIAVTWTPHRPLPAGRSLTVTVPEQSGGGHAGTAFDIGGFLGAMADSIVNGVTKVVQTVGAGLASAGNAVASWWAGAAQALTRPNGSGTNNVLTCASLGRDDGQTICNGPYTLQRGVPTQSILAMDAGSRVIAAGGGNVIAAGGGNVIAAGGGNVIAAGAGNLVVEGATVIAAGGGNVIAAGGGNVIAAGGGNVIAAGGGNVIAAGGGNLTMTFNGDPGIGFVTPATEHAAPPTVQATFDPPLPAEGGSYPPGTTVHVHLAANSPDGTEIDNVNYQVDGAGETPYTMAVGDTADLVIDAAGTSTLSYGAHDAALNDAEPQSIEIVIDAPEPAGAPTDVAAERVDNISAQVSWTAPVDLGNPALTGYAVTVLDDGTIPAGEDAAADRVLRFGGTGTSRTVSGLAPGHVYRFRVGGYAGTGAERVDGAMSAPTEPVRTATVPDAPTGLTAVAGDGTVGLTWSAPLGDGGLPLGDYVVYRGPSAGGPWTPLPDPPAAPSYVDDSPENGSTYHYAVTAANALGESAMSATASATPRSSIQDQTISFPAPADTRYGGADPALAATASSGLPVAYQSSTSSVCTVLEGRAHVLGAGECTITASQSGGEHWAPAAEVTRSFQVARAPLTITASDAIMTAGGQLPPVTPAYGGFVAGDRAADLVAAPTCVANEAARTTSCSGARSPDYAIEYRDGTLTVEAPPAAQHLTITVPASVSYADESVPVSAMSDAGLPVGLAAGPATVCSLAGARLVVHHAGACRITATQPGDRRFRTAELTRDVTIRPATLTVRATDATRARRGRLPAVAARFGGFVRGESVLDLDRAPRCKAVKKRRRTVCRGAADADYVFRYVTGRLRKAKSRYAVVSAPLVYVRVGDSLRFRLRATGRHVRIKASGHRPPGVRVRHNGTGRAVLKGRAASAGTWTVKVVVRKGHHKVARQRLRIVVLD